MYIDIVKKYRAKYDYLSGDERAGTITNAVALELGLPWGLLRKTSGTNYKGYKTDVLLNKDTKEFVDVLGSSGEDAIPGWDNRDATSEEMSNWAPPYSGEETIPTPTPSPEGPVIPEIRDTLTSSDGRFKLIMQSDGNLVIYEDGKPIWDKNTPRG